MPISDDQYNSARNILVNADSNSALASHPKHNTRGGSPSNHGISLLQEARDEFQRRDAGNVASHYKSSMTKAHYDAIHGAATALGFEDRNGVNTNW